ncbi:LysR family transcriptional regulator [Naasia sp. SYSU D00057]|uniref:LysR family transcriptional regulator n=1 Tax=Naasia sp. SYSU D00057 TaxID=2817380 RepID=UPI001B30BFDB|nr:LysR family transcriptional regulator [Naasia sp. SYSU D00057]
MDVRRLELLRELAERGSITAVARATHRTPSAVSQQLKVLEREIGLPLTERQGRGIVLNDAGKTLARTATDIAVAIERAEAVWEAFVQAPAGEVTIATFPTAGQMFVPGLLAAAAAHPGLSLLVTDRDPPLNDFPRLTNDFDVVLAHSPGRPHGWRDAGLAVEELLVEPLDVALPPDHPLTAREVLTPADLVDETWIGVPVTFPFQHVLTEIERVTGRPPKVAQRFSDTRITEAVVARGGGVAILPRFTAHSAPIALRPLIGVPSERHISALTRRDRLERPSVRLVIELLRGEAAAVER